MFIKSPSQRGLTYAPSSSRCAVSFMRCRKGQAQLAARLGPCTPHSLPRPCYQRHGGKIVKRHSTGRHAKCRFKYSESSVCARPGGCPWRSLRAAGLPVGGHGPRVMAYAGTDRIRNRHRSPRVSECHQVNVVFSYPQLSDPGRQTVNI